MLDEAPNSALRRLHVGGKARHAGWEVLDVIGAEHVDHVGNARDLSQFGDATFTEIYASHVLEHFDYAGELQSTLREWRRVLVPGGVLAVSVPDLDVLATLLLARDQLTTNDRFFVMRMMFGGHTDPFDYHQVGFNQEFLAHFLNEAGFIDILRVEDLGRFEDTSRMRYKDIPISLNVLARNP
jgi:predicted SAM-dependent methyltransferase